MISDREVQLIDYPTIKIPIRHQAILGEVEHVLRQAKVPNPRVRRNTNLPLGLTSSL